MSLIEHCRAPFIVVKLGAALCFVTAVSCGGSNEPSVMDNSNTSSGDKSASDDSKNTTAGSTAPASSDAAGKAATGSGGSPSSSSSGAGMSASKAGSSASSGAGGSSSSSSGTSTAGSGTGSNATGGSTGGGMFSPLCDAVPPTAAGAQPTKAGACTESDTQLCYKTCGPQSIGFKSETCTNGAYAEMTGCTFPDADYACFKIPATQDASCPTTIPQASMPCEVAECTPCAVGGMYNDSSGSAKAGYCVCPKAGDSGMRKWSCASTTAWPCPTGKGC